MMTLVKTEKNPSVIMFNGTESKLSIGLMIKKSNARANPPNRKETNPPLTISPAMICEIKNRHRLFITIDLKSDFIILS